MVMGDYTSAPRIYNQVHIPRKATPGHRRVSIYVTWSYPAEANQDVTVLDNRFSSMTEIKRVEWPNWEGPEWSDPHMFLQGIDGGLEIFFRAWMPFQEVITQVTGHPVPVYQRVDQAGTRLPLDERVFADADTVFVFGLDHTVTNQIASDDEIMAVKKFLEREGTYLILCPHHDVGSSEDLKMREIEYRHHGDALVPRQQQFAGYLRSLIRELKLPIENQWGLRPAVIEGSKNQIAPLSRNLEADTHRWLEGVTSFNFHKHLPHYAVTDPLAKNVHVLAKQKIDPSHSHPFLEAGNKEFNTFVWVAPEGERKGDVIFIDSTVFSSLFGVNESLKQFWKNIISR
jgi:hypothetical protein